MKKRAQSSIEFLAVTGIGLLLIVGVSATYLTYSKGNEDKTRIQEATTAGQNIIQQAKTAYALGKNSWLTLEVTMPDKVLAIYTVENNTLVFDIGTQHGIISQPIFSSVPILGVNDMGTKNYITNGSVLLHAGKTGFRVTSLGANVTIQAVS